MTVGFPSSQEDCRILLDVVVFVVFRFGVLIKRHGGTSSCSCCLCWYVSSCFSSGVHLVVVVTPIEWGCTRTRFVGLGLYASFTFIDSTSNVLCIFIPLSYEEDGEENCKIVGTKLCVLESAVFLRVKGDANGSCEPCSSTSTASEAHASLELSSSPRSILALFRLPGVGLRGLMLLV